MSKLSNKAFAIMAVCEKTKEHFGITVDPRNGCYAITWAFKIKKEQAKKEGYEQIAAIFQETADNEKEHAKLWFKLLNGGEIGTTVENLKAAAEGENFEWTDMYERMAKEAKEEGFDHIAFLFTEVGKIEKEHEARYKKLLEKVEEGKVFEAGEIKIWKCRNCGHIVVGTKAPEVCPVCAHPKAYFEIKAENY